MQNLNFPLFHFRFDRKRDKELIFDPVRKKFVNLSPEEWVRQNMLCYLVEIGEVPLSLIGVEKQLLLNGLKKRFDLVVFDRSGIPVMLIECKAPSVGIKQEVFDQAARYNMQLKARYFLITNGLEHYCCKIDYQKGAYDFIEGIPSYAELLDLYT
ncbi:MAG: type I restriction enzyme HsdR N-terminal domain-containing protein [Bacteroidetes bacterium]|nr:type I restriction enzyme HsdR N-terminal domain-containing protein [Bacteroidota bacterium]